MDYRKRGSHARGEYPTGYLAHENSKEEADKNNSKRVVRNMEDRNVGTKGESPKQGLTVELPRDVILWKALIIINFDLFSTGVASYKRKLISAVKAIL